MSLKQTLDKLLLLQSLNRDLDRLSRDKAALQQDIDHQRSLLEQMRQERERLKNERVENQKKADSLELKIRETEQTNARLQVQLNTTKHQSEYDAVRKSIMSNMADISRWEDEELQLLERTDALRRQEAELDARLEAESEGLKRIEQSVAQDSADYERRMRELTERREHLRREIDPETLSIFDRIARSRGATAIVKVKGRICQGCYTSLPKQTENELMRGTRLVYCHNCGRILVLDEEDALAP